ncbi:MAG: cation transporter, partial [Burkholderiales bacterium]|nr:cation transporter [Burkholderiales bacterium]
GLKETTMRLKQTIFATTLVLLLSASFAAHAASRSVTLELEGMYCPMCPVTIKTALDFADGVFETKVGRNPDEALIRYDDVKTSPAKLIEVVKKSGYGAHVKPPRAKP